MGLAVSGTMPAAAQTPVKFGPLCCVYVTLLITSGVPSVVTAESTDGITVADTAAGRYTVTFDAGGCEALVHASGCIENPDSSVATDACYVQFNGLDLSAGTVELNTVSDVGSYQDPETGSKVRFKMEFATR